MFINPYMALNFCLPNQKCAKSQLWPYGPLGVKQQKRKSVWEEKLGEGRRENVQGVSKHGADSDHGEEGFTQSETCTEKDQMLI